MGSKPSHERDDWQLGDKHRQSELATRAHLAALRHTCSDALAPLGLPHTRARRDSQSAFHEGKSLASVKIGNSVTSIGQVSSPRARTRPPLATHVL